MKDISSLSLLSLSFSLFLSLSLSLSAFDSKFKVLKVLKSCSCLQFLRESERSRFRPHLFGSS